MSERPLAVVTGGNSGIGLELSRLFAKDGYDLVLVARDEKRLADAAAELSQLGAKVDTLAVDLGDADGPGQIAAALGSREVTALVNNAGFGLQGSFVATSLETELKMIQVNVTSLVQLTKSFTAGMVARKKGYILNVGSTAGFQPGPNMAIYYASKAFVNSFSQALRMELAPHGIHVSALCPGPVETGFQARAQFSNGKLFKMRSAIVPAADVAKAGYQGLMKNKAVVIPGFMNKVANSSQRFLPRNLVTKMAGNMNELS